MVIKYVIKNKRGNYLPNNGNIYFTKNIEKAAMFSKSIAKKMCFGDAGEMITKVDVQITELND